MHNIKKFNLVKTEYNYLKKQQFYKKHNYCKFYFKILITLIKENNIDTDIVIFIKKYVLVLTQ